MRAVQAILAVLAAVATGVAVYWIKYGTEAWLGTLSDNMLAVVVGLMVAVVCLTGIWLEIRALIKGRQERQQAGRRDGAEGEPAGD